jgi:hypothetical protein
MEMIARIFLLVGIATSVYASDNRNIDKLERIRTHFDIDISKATNHHKRAVIFNDAIKEIGVLVDLDQDLKNETIKHFVNVINRIEKETLDLIVLSAPEIADSVKHIENIEGKRHELLVQIDDLENVSRAARTSAKHYITKLFDDRKTALSGTEAAGKIHAPEEVKKHHAHEHVVSVHGQRERLDELVGQFYTDIYNKRLSSHHMQHKLDDVITKINALRITDKDKEVAVKDVTNAAQARLHEQGEKLPQRGAEKKPKRRLKGSVAHTEEETKGRRHAESRKPTTKTTAAEPKKESVTQQAARLRKERAERAAQKKAE